VQVGRLIVERRAAGSRQVLLRVVSARGSESSTAHALPESVLVDLPSFLKKLPDGHYRLYLAENEFTPPRILVDVMIFRGRAVSSGDMQAGRPPTQDLIDRHGALDTKPDNFLAKPSRPAPTQSLSPVMPMSPDGPALHAPGFAVPTPASAERSRR
jgi:hypothetical protein